MDKFLKFFHNPRNLFVLGLAIAFALTFVDFMRGRHFNFMIFADSTRDFWAGISPYTDDWVAEHKRFFLYSPIFSVLFSPFALLPQWLGPFAWNLFNYVMFFAAIFALPRKFTREQKCRMFMFTFPILAQSLLSFQYNIVVAYIFLFAYGLLERDRGFWAVLLIMISGTTKIYGIFQLGLLLCYPHFWRNMGYTAVTGAALFALPLLKLAPSEFMPYYGEWFYSLSSHQSAMTFDSIFYAKPLLHLTLPYFRIIQIVSISILAVLLLANRRKWGDPDFRAQALGVLMGWVILFSDSAEKHTYVIALAGYMLWYFSRTPRRVDKWLLWANFGLMCIVPIDILFPVRWMRFICYTLWLNVWTYLATWLRMVYITFFRPSEPAAAITDYPPHPGAMSYDLDIVLPCYNPADGFIGVLAERFAALESRYPDKRMRLIVSNDGSTRNFGPDVRAALAAAIPGTLIVGHEKNAGKGAAVRDGIAASDAPFTIYTDIDMPYSPESMCEVIDKVFEGCDVVIAVRNRSYYSKLSPLRKLMSHGSQMMNRLFLGTRHTDTQGGLKGLSPRAREIMLRTRIDSFLFDTEFVALASRSKDIRIADIETTLREDVVLSKMSYGVLFRELGNFFKIIFRR